MYKRKFNSVVSFIFMGINFMDLVETVFRICNFVDNNPITKYQEICTSMNTEFQG